MPPSPKKDTTIPFMNLGHILSLEYANFFRVAVYVILVFKVPRSTVNVLLTDAIFLQHQFLVKVFSCIRRGNFFLIF